MGESILRPDEWPDREVEPNGQYQDKDCIHAARCAYWKLGVKCPCIHYADDYDW